MTIRSVKHVAELARAGIVDTSTKKKLHALIPAILIGANPFFKEGLRSVLLNKVRVLADINTIEGLDQVERIDERAVILIDCATEADVGRVAEVAGRLRERSPTARVIVLASPDVAGVSRLVTLGAANAVVRRDISRDTLIRLIDIVAENFTIVSEGLLTRSDTPAATAPAPAESEECTEGRPILASGRTLSDRESAILRCLVQGESNKAIARRLAIAEATVKIHVKGVLRKISVSNRTQAAIWALTHLTPAKPRVAVAPVERTSETISGVNGDIRSIRASAESRPL